MLEKIDIIDQDVCCYNEQYNLEKVLKLSQFLGIDFSYLEGAKLFTLNITQPIKRVVKFTDLNGVSLNDEFVIFPYDDMTPEQKIDFDSFVEQANTL